MASKTVKLVVAAVVREALYGLPDEPGKVVVAGRRRQIMSSAFPYIDVVAVSDDEFLDQLRADIKKTVERLS